MAFDGPMLAASVARALAAIPGAIKNMRDLLSGREPKPESAVEKLDELRTILISLERIGEGFRELKEVHNTLQRLYIALDRIRDHLKRAVEHGPFDTQIFKLGEVRREWDAVQFHLRGVLIACKSLKLIDKPLQLGNDDSQVIDGPAWAARLVDLRNSINDSFDEYDKAGKATDRLVIQVRKDMQALVSHVEDHMQKADERIRKDFQALGPLFVTLAMELRNA